MNKLSEEERRDLYGWMVAIAVAIPSGILFYRICKAIAPDGPLTWMEILRWMGLA